MDTVLEFIRRQAQLKSEVTRVILFGSRARGDHNFRSDYDLAIIAPTFSRDNWVIWSQELKEKIPTLCGLDLILIDVDTSATLKKAIDQEGVVIYEKN